MSKTKNGCLVEECRREPYARGMCRSCYESARRQIVAGNRSWEELVEMGLARTAQRVVRNPLTLALQRAEQEAS